MILKLLDGLSSKIQVARDALCARLGMLGACKHHTNVHSSQCGTAGTKSRRMSETFSPILG